MGDLPMKKTIDFGTLKISIDATENLAVYNFVGDIDENFKENEIPRSPGLKTIFDLGGINNINSIGIREWIKLANGFKDSKELLYKNCSIIFIDQVNMVPDSIGTAKIVSFYAPYFIDCGDCSGEKVCLLDVNEDQAFIKQQIGPPRTCKECNKVLEFDALEESYFSFIDKEKV